MSTDLLLSAREVEDGRGGRWMALLSTAVTLVLLVGAGVWWVVAGRGGEDGSGAGTNAAVGRAAAPLPGGREDASAGAASAPAEGTPFYFLLVDSAVQAVAVREQWDESNRRRVLHGLPELDGSVFMVGPGDDMGWLYRDVAYIEEGSAVGCRGSR